MARSLGYYYNLLFWVNYLIYSIYFVIKYLVGPIFWILLEKANKADKNSCLAQLANITKPMQKLVLKFFSEPLGVTQRHEHANEMDQQDDNDIPILYIRDKKLSYGAVMLLAMLIVTFGVLTLSSAVNSSIFKVTHNCSEVIDCYPQLKSGVDEKSLSPFNLTININQPIRDCTPWDSTYVSRRVTFICFQFALDGTAFLATTGGLLTIFTTIMKISTAVLLWLTAKCNCRLGCCQTARAILSVAAALIEVALAIMCLVLGVLQITKGSFIDNKRGSSKLIFFIMEGAKPLIIFGIVTTLLWLPWEKYAQKPTQDSDDNALKLEDVTATPGSEYLLMNNN